MSKIQNFINDRNKYKVDRTYQRPSDAWSLDDNQCLIDTIIKDEPMPLFFLNYKTDEDIYYVVDGQQRLNAIMKFHNNKLKLNKKFSDKSLHGKTFNGDNPIDDKTKKAFLDYKLNFKILEDYDDEKVRIIFSRLQRGKPLQLGEKLNACPGDIVNCMRDIANHKFLSKSTGVPQNRYGIYPDAARILFYEVYGAKQCGSKELFQFFDDKSDINKKLKEYKNAISVLNYLEKCFPSKPGNYHFLEKHAWVFAAYTMVRDLKMFYSLEKNEKVIFKFINNFHKHVYDEDFRSSNRIYQKFYENVRGGWSENIIILRRDTLITEFLKKNKLKELDLKRQISDEEKLIIFSKLSDQLCGICRTVKFNKYKDAEYHHIDRYIDGGKTKKENIMAICKECHKRLHGKIAIITPTEDDIEDNNNGD